jgi:hypothetical protein
MVLEKTLPPDEGEDPADLRLESVFERDLA